jgi:hypothetical protein
MVTRDSDLNTTGVVVLFRSNGIEASLETRTRDAIWEAG